MPYYIKRKKAKKKDKPLPLFDKAGITVKKKPDLKAKLDKEFSLFIRLRDCMPNGVFRCNKLIVATISVVHIWRPVLMKTIVMPNADTAIDSKPTI